MADDHGDDRARGAGLSFGVLGPLRVEGAAGEIPVTSEKQRRLLAVLVVHVGAVISTDRLSEVLWGERPPPSAEKSLQTYVARLRRSLGFPAGTVGPVLTRPPGYLLDVDPHHIDAHRFARLRHQASEVLADDPGRALALLDEALGLWRGDALAEFADLDFARAEAERLEELRTAAHEDRFDAELALGRHRAVIGPLETFATRHPYRERPHAQLMLALYRSGRHADALSVFARYRHRLIEELGLEPSGSLRALESGVLQQRAELDWSRPAAAPTTGVDRTADRVQPTTVPIPARHRRPRPPLRWWAATATWPRSWRCSVRPGS